MAIIERQTKGRIDYDLIESFVCPECRLLDLGCGDGQLLEQLARNKQCQGYGIEIKENLVLDCIRRGIPVYHGDMLEGMANYQDDAFDVVVLSQTLHQTTDPRQVIHEMLRVGRTAIISFRNMGHWSARWHLLVKGSMPVNSLKPYAWYDSPNVHLCTVSDFRELCVQEGLPITHTVFLARSGRPVPKGVANLMAELALFQIGRQH